MSLEIANIFDQYDHLLSGLATEQYKVIRAIKNCRTSFLGGHKLKCNSCNYQANFYNSCRNRHCPKCGFLARTKWIEKRSEDLFDCQYFHVVFTLPAKLRNLILRNKRVSYDLLFRAAADTLKAVASNPDHLGAEIGFIGVLHTWSQNLLDHPHVHFLVPGGGLQGERWINCKQDYFLPVEILSKVFRGKILEYFEDAFHKEEFEFKGSIDYLASFSNFKGLLMDCAQKDFVVYSKKPFGGPAQVIKYLGQYTHRIAISNYRLVKVEDQKVFFKVRDKKSPEKSKVISLDVREFMRRFLLHVLPKAYVRIRHYGLLGTRLKKVKIALIRKLQQLKESLPEAVEICWKELMKSAAEVDVDQCPKCSDGKLVPCCLLASALNSS